MKNISFKSNINFVSSKKFFRKFKKGQYIDEEKDQTVSDEFYTMNVATCTAGGIIIPHKKAYGFHFSDSRSYVFANSASTEYNEEARGLIIGSKQRIHRPYSIQNFVEMQKFMLKEMRNLSVFQQHRYTKEHANFHYSLKDDTWTINTRFQELGRSIEVLDLKSLVKAFKTIKIAKGDRLFLDGKEVTVKDFPVIFEEGNEKNGKLPNLFGKFAIGIMRIL